MDHRQKNDRLHFTTDGPGMVKDVERLAAAEALSVSTWLRRLVRLEINRLAGLLDTDNGRV